MAHLQLGLCIDQLIRTMTVLYKSYAKIAKVSSEKKALYGVGRVYL